MAHAQDADNVTSPLTRRLLEEARAREAQAAGTNTDDVTATDNPRLTAVPDLPGDTEVVEPESVWTPTDYAAFGVLSGGAEKLASSAVAPLVAAARGYYTCGGGALAEEAKRWHLGARGAQRERYEVSAERGDLLAMPWLSVVRETGVTWQIRPDVDAAAVTGGASKYEFIGGQKTVVGLHPALSLGWAAEAGTVLVAEGLLKGDAALSAWLADRGATAEQLAWGRPAEGAAEALRDLLGEVAPDPADRLAIFTIGGSGNWHNNAAEWDLIEVRNKRVLLGFDGDVATNPAVHAQAEKLGKLLKKKRAKTVEYILLPTTAGDEHAGIDDFVAAGHTWVEVCETAGQLPAKPVKAKVSAVQGYRWGDANLSVPDPSRCAETADLPTTYLGLGQRVVAHYRGRLAWCPEIARWRFYDGRVWKLDDTKGTLATAAVFATMRSITEHEAAYAEAASQPVRDLLARIEVLEAAGQEPSAEDLKRLEAERASARAEHVKFGTRCEDRGTALSRALEHARAALTVPEHMWDRHTLLVNAPNGTYHVGKRILREHRADDYITRMTAVPIDLNAPMTADLEAVLEHMDRQRDGARLTLTRWAGLSLTGVMDARSALSIEGTSGSAKTTFFEALLAAAGGTAETAYGTSPSVSALELRSTRSGGGHQDALHQMMGHTLVLVDEAQGAWVDGETLKRLISGSTISTSPKGSGTVSWESRAHLTIIGNGRWHVRADDAALAGRIIPETFRVKVSDDGRATDGHLERRLRKEPANLTALLAVVVTAASDWYAEKKELQAAGHRDAARHALHPSGDLSKLQVEWAAESNQLSPFIADTCEVGDEEDLQEQFGDVGKIDTTNLLRAYNRWAPRAGQEKLSEKRFVTLLAALGVEGTTEKNNLTVSFKLNPDDAYEQKVRLEGKRIRKGIRMTNLTLWQAAADGRLL